MCPHCKHTHAPEHHDKPITRIGVYHIVTCTNPACRGNYLVRIPQSFKGAPHQSRMPAAGSSPL